jgi:hypothetical protein
MTRPQTASSTQSSSRKSKAETTLYCLDSSTLTSEILIQLLGATNNLKDATIKRANILSKFTTSTRWEDANTIWALSIDSTKSLRKLFLIMIEPYKSRNSTTQRTIMSVV